jgi:ribosomal-protein-alanine N-acetyltransferase
MTEPRLATERLELRPLPAAAAAALADDRETAARTLGVALSPVWPHADLLDILPLQAAAAPVQERFGVWVMIERETETVVGDIGFRGPPGPDRTVEIGYSVVPDRRRRGYATEAARALIAWALSQPGVGAIVAGCDQGNLPSIRTLERLGFSRTGEAKGELRWCLRPGRSARRDSDDPRLQPAVPPNLSGGAIID